MDSNLAGILADVLADSPATLLCESCLSDWNYGDVPFSAESARNWPNVIGHGAYALAIGGNCEVCHWPLGD